MTTSLTAACISDATTVVTSNVSGTSSSSIVVNQLPDDDPDDISTKSDHTSSTATSTIDPTEIVDLETVIPVNSIQVPPILIDPSPDILPDPEEKSVDPEPASTSSPVSTPINSLQRDSPRAHLDTAAFASVTDLKHMLHDYQEFSSSHPCPVLLQPATEGSDTRSLGFGYLHVPAETYAGYIAIRTFYHPTLRTTVIYERDFIKAIGLAPSDYQGSTLIKFDEAGSWTHTNFNQKSEQNNLVIHGVLWHGKCYTQPLIPPSLPIDHPQATAATSHHVALTEDPEFAEACTTATIQNIFLYQEKAYQELRSNLANLPVKYHDLPFHHYIQDNTPISAIRAHTERLLWHQRLGHPSDYYLYNAHKHVKGIPKFAHQD